MALVVEDGTGKTDAESYISVADTDTYVQLHLRSANTDRVEWLAAATADKEIALRQATDWLDIQFQQRWQGRRSNEDQALAWPRWGVVDFDGYTIESDSLPQDLLDATAEMAARGVSGDLFSDIDSPAGAIKRTRDKVGPLESEIEYTGSATQQAAYVKAEKIVAQLLMSSAAQPFVERG